MKRILCALCFSLVGWQALAGEGDNAYKHATEAVKTAKTAADLDGIIEEIASVMDRYTPMMGNPPVAPHPGLTIGELDATRTFVQKWQEYLAAKAGGYDDEARSIAKELAHWPIRLLPRSEILAKAYEPKNSGDKNAPEVAFPTPVTIDIDQEGRVSIGKDAPVALEKVEAAILPLLASNPNLPAVIRAHKSQPYSKIREVITVLQRAGVNKIGFVKPNGSEPSVPAATPAFSPAK